MVSDQLCEVLNPLKTLLLNPVELPPHINKIETKLVAIKVEVIIAIVINWSITWNK